MKKWGWGGRRPGAGRKPRGPLAGVPHRVRAPHAAAHPVLVTFAGRAEAGSLRAPRVFPAIREAIAAGSGEGFRVVHFSVQPERVYLLVEARSRETLSRGVQGLAIRIARAANRVLGRHGRFWADRYRTRTSRTPQEVRQALVDVLLAFRRHDPEARGADPCSSGPWFTGWQPQRGRLPSGVVFPPVDVPPPVEPPRTALLRDGWRRLGLVGPAETPTPLERPAGRA